MRGHTSATTIEFFLWTQDGEKGNRLIYYDQTGNSHEKEVSGTALDNALNFFSTKARSVRRSSGGLILAEPTQIVVYDQPNQKPSIRVRVKFKDFNQSEAKKLVCVSHTKTVAPEELHDPFSYEFDGPRAQTFALDLGKGIVPVRVFSYEEQDGVPYAYFVELKDAVALTAEDRGAPITIQTFRVEQRTLRWTGPASGGPTREMQKAARNYQSILAKGEAAFPKELKACAPIEIPANRKSDEAWQFLREQVRNTLSTATEPVYLQDNKDKSEILLPFPVLE